MTQLATVGAPARGGPVLDLGRADTAPTVTLRRVPVEADDTTRERLLVERIVAGDETALATVYDAWSSFVFALSHRICRDRALAEDVTQEVFLHLWERADAFDAARASLRTWLGMLAHRRSVDRVRREEARRAREERDGQRAAMAVADVEERALRAVTSGSVAHALAELPADQRTCVVLAYFEGMTFKEVAAALSIPEGTAKSRIRLALAKLADALEGTTTWI